ncbi:hypothetical protein [Thiolapillus sp.]
MIDEFYWNWHGAVKQRGSFALFTLSLGIMIKKVASIQRVNKDSK